MTSLIKLWKYGLIAVSSIVLVLAVQAQDAGKNKAGQSDDQATWKTWLEKRNEVVPASDILAGNVTSGFNAIGNIEEIILNENRDKLEYVLYEPFWPPSIHGTGGFVYFDDIKLERGAGNDIDVRFDPGFEPEAPDQLELTAEEAQNRRVSRLIGEDMKFAQGEALNIEDLFVDPASGEVTHLIVDANEDNLFGREFRAVPIDQVDLSKDQPSAKMQISELSNQQEYDPDLIILMLEGRN